MVKNTRKSSINNKKQTKKKIHGLSKKNLTIKTTKFFHKIIKKHHDKRKKNTKKNKGQKQKGGKNVVNPNPENFDVVVKPDSIDKFSKISLNDDSYNNNVFVRESHNCYTYFLNMKSQKAVELCKNDFGKHNMCRRAQPGYFSGHDILEKKNYSCPVIMKRTLDDNPEIYKIKNINEKCDPKFYKGALVVAPGRDYHYYRQDDDGSGFWSHKPGYKPTTTRDSNGNLIVDPQLAARDYGGTLNYKDFCGYLCVPRSANHKNMAHRGELDKNARKVLEKAYETQEKITGKPPPKNKDNRSQNSRLVTIGKKLKEFI